MLDGLVVPIYQAAYSFLEAIAALCWFINQALLLVGYYLMALSSWLSDTAFAPVMSQVIGQTSGLLAPIFGIAMLLLAITYFLRVFFDIQIVEFKGAIMWLLFALMVFQFGPEIYQGTEDMRRGIGGVFYSEGIASLSADAGSISGLNDVGTTPEVAMATVQNNFIMWLPEDVGIDGLDVALAYLFADGCDVLKASGCVTLGVLPQLWYEPSSQNTYFDNTADATSFPGMNNEERLESLDKAMAGVVRQFTGIIISLFGLLEQVIHLILAIAMGVAYLSLMIAVLFGFFKKTEPVAWSVVNMIVGLFIQSLITSLLLSVVMSLVIVGAGTGNGVLLLGASMVGIVLLIVLMMGAINAVKSTINGLIEAMSTVSGGHFMTVTQAGGMVGGAAVSATAGAIAAARTGSMMQGAGVALSGNQALSRGAMMAASTFGDETLLGSMAGNFHAGASGAQFSGRGAAAFLLPSSYEDLESDSEYGLYPGSSRRATALASPIRSDDYDDDPEFPAGRPHDQLRNNRDAYLGSGKNPAVIQDAYSDAGLEAETLAKTLDGLNDDDFEEGLNAYNGARQTYPQSGSASPATVRRSFASRLSPDNPLASNADQSDAFIAAADAGVDDYNKDLAYERTERRIAREDATPAPQDETTAPAPPGNMALTPRQDNNNLSSSDIARLDASDDDDFANLSEHLTRAVASTTNRSQSKAERRIDPVTNDPYTFKDESKEDGYKKHLREYDDGSTVAVDENDVPMHHSNLGRSRFGGIQRPAGYVDDTGQLSYALENPGDEEGFDIHPDARRVLPDGYVGQSSNETGGDATNSRSSSTLNSSEAPPMDMDTLENLASRETQGDTFNTAPHAIGGSSSLNTDSLAASIDSSLEEVEEVSRSVPQSTANPPASQPSAQPAPADDLTAIRGIGPTTQMHLNNAGIHSYADLAQADPASIQAAVPKLSSENAGRYTRQASELATGQIAPASGGLTADMSGIVSALQSALSGISVDTGNKEASAQIAQAAGVPGAASMPAVGYYARMASGMGLSPQLAGQVAQDTAQSGQMGQDTSQAVRQALSAIQTPSGGQPGDSGMQQAVNSLQQAASAMATAVNTGASSSGQGSGAPQGGNTNTVHTQASDATIGKAADVGELDRRGD